MKVIDAHENSLSRSTILSQFWRKKVISPLEVVTVLNRERISFVLVGAYGLAGWINEPRATEDVDVVVAAKQVKRAVKALLMEFPHLEEVDLPVVVRLRERESDIIAVDVMKPHQQPYREVFRHTKTVSVGNEEYRVPSLEMALVMKFAAMTSLYRADDDKHQDAHDFIRMIKNNPEIDELKLTKLASLMYSDGGKDLLGYVGKVKAGKPLVI